MLEPKLSLTNATPGLEVVLGDLEAAKMENNEGNMVRRKSGPFLLHGRVSAEIQKKAREPVGTGCPVQPCWRKFAHGDPRFQVAKFCTISEISPRIALLRKL